MSFYGDPELINSLKLDSEERNKDPKYSEEKEDIVENKIYGFQRELISMNQEENLKSSKDLITSNLRKNNFFEEEINKSEVKSEIVNYNIDFLKENREHRPKIFGNMRDEKKDLRRTFLRKNYFMKGDEGNLKGNVFF